MKIAAAAIRSDAMEIYDKKKQKYYEVWLTNSEQSEVDRNALSKQLLTQKKDKKYKVVFFMSGDDDLYRCTESLLLMNLGCA